MISDVDKIEHVRCELGRGHVARCPRSWLIRVRKLTSGTDLAEACQIALDVHRSGVSVNPRQREMRKLAGRKLA